MTIVQTFKNKRHSKWYDYDWKLLENIAGRCSVMVHGSSEVSNETDFISSDKRLNLTQVSKTRFYGTTLYGNY